jgi:hypothetical protein
LATAVARFAVVFLAVDFRAGALLAVVFLAVDVRAGAFLAVVFLAVVFLAVVFLAVVFLAVAFLAVDFRAGAFVAVVFLAVDFRAGAFLAVVFLAVDFLVAGLAVAVDRLTAALAAVARFATVLRAEGLGVLAAAVARLTGDLAADAVVRRLVVVVRVDDFLTGVMVVSLRLLLLGRLGGLLGRLLRRRRLGRARLFRGCGFLRRRFRSELLDHALGVEGCLEGSCRCESHAFRRCDLHGFTRLRVTTGAGCPRRRREGAEPEDRHPFPRPGLAYHRIDEGHDRAFGMTLVESGLSCNRVDEL